MQYLYWICRDLNLNVQYYEEPVKISAFKETNLSLFFIDYIKLAMYLKDEYRKLVNNSLFHGYVFIPKDQLIRLLQEFVRNEILRFQKAYKEEIDEKRRTSLENALIEISLFKNIFEKIKILIDTRKLELNTDYYETMSYKNGKDLSTFFPPCIKFIFSKIQEDQNLVHNERLFLVFFLHALKYPLDKMINIFKRLPDFDEKIARYQIEFAIKKGYVPHGCAKLETLGMCQKDHKNFGEKLCQEGFYSKKQARIIKISHPIFFMKIKKPWHHNTMSEKRNEKNSNNKIEEKPKEIK